MDPNTNLIVKLIYLRMLKFSETIGHLFGGNIDWFVDGKFLSSKTLNDFLDEYMVE